MAVEKMVLLNLVGSLEDEQKILEQLVLCESLHLDMKQYELGENSFMVHEYECMIPHKNQPKPEDYIGLEQKYNKMMQELKVLGKGIENQFVLDRSIDMNTYTIDQAEKDLDRLKESVGSNLRLIEKREKQLEEYRDFNNHIKGFRNTKIDLAKLKHLKYFEYRLGILSRENKMQIRKNYENISALVLRVGDMEESKEDIYLMIYPKQFKEETDRLLKSLNWSDLKIPEGLEGEIYELLNEVTDKIGVLEAELSMLRQVTKSNEDDKRTIMNKIYTCIRLQQQVIKIKKQLIHGNNLFVLSAWIPEKERYNVEARLSRVTDKYVIMLKDDTEIDEYVMPPTRLKNNRLFKPFEMIVKLYGLPSYKEIDPTPFLAITFCLMFGIMFGDIGQGLVYLVAGLLLYKKNEVAGGILARLGSFSILFGFIYGSLFGLEQHELPWLPSLIGSPLATDNIMFILMSGVAFGVVVLTVSFIIGIINALKQGDIEEGIFGKNGVVGYVFFLGLVLTLVSLLGVVPVSPFVFLTIMVIALIIMILKEPLTHMVTGKRPYIKGPKGSYFIESGFEGLETVLGALSNTISFIRVGAFALNHAGLFMAFLVMSQMTDNMLLKILILFIGNMLILTLEGLVVFIQGLRLQYYEMFSKYFRGDGFHYNPITLDQTKLED